MSKERCRNHLKASGKSYPKSGCEVCGGMFNACKYPPNGAFDSRNQLLALGNSTNELLVKKENGKCYWSIGLLAGDEWEEIPESLYLELFKFGMSKGYGR